MVLTCRFNPKSRRATMYSILSPFFKIIIWLIWPGAHAIPLLDLEELLHQLGVGREGAHSHNRKRRSITGSSERGAGQPLNGCNQDSRGVSRDWAQVKFIREYSELRFKTYCMTIILLHVIWRPSYSLFFWIQSGVFFSQSVGGYFCSGSSFANFQGALQPNLSSHYSAVARQCLWDCSAKNKRISAHCSRE